MRKLFRYREAAEKFYGGDEETLRHALVLGVVRARVELLDEADWVWWADGDTEDGNPADGQVENAIWKRTWKPGRYKLTGWFFVESNAASKIAHGRMIAKYMVSPEEEEEYFLGTTFFVNKLIDINDLWFEASKYPDRLVQPGDENLKLMAEAVEKLTDDQRVIARFRIAANAGIDGIDIDELMHLEEDFHRLNVVAVAKAAMASANEVHRQHRAKGGKTKAANDPKQAAKTGALELWIERHAGKHPKLKTVEQYATAVMRRWPVLQSADVIRRWSAKWSKQVRNGETPTL